MGRYTKVRGWLDLSSELVPALRQIIEHAPETADSFGLSVEHAEFYNRGWVIPKDHINWTHFVFFGADIRTESVDYIRAQFEAAANIRHHWSTSDPPYSPNGLVHLDEEEHESDGYPHRLWEIANGRLQERIR